MRFALDSVSLQNTSRQKPKHCVAPPLKEDEEETEDGSSGEEDSDEEFYVDHKALLPLRKSKSCYTTSAFAFGNSRKKNSTTVAEQIDFSKGDVMTVSVALRLENSS